MSTPTAPERFNAVDIASWLREEMEKTGNPAILISLHARGDPIHAWYWDSSKGIDVCADAKTVGEAIKLLNEKACPASRAELKREQASKLLAEAQQIEQEASEMETAK